MRQTNVIVSVGFGKGKLSIFGSSRPEHNYSIVRKFSTSLSLVYHPLTESVWRIPNKNPGEVLTFDFFKFNFICQEHPELCIDLLPKNFWNSSMDLGRKGLGQTN